MKKILFSVLAAGMMLTSCNMDLDEPVQLLIPKRFRLCRMFGNSVTISTVIFVHSMPELM